MRWTHIGKWYDIIKLSTKTIHFNKNKNTTTITTKGTWWWIKVVSVNEKNFIPPQDIDGTSDSYIFKEDCFIIERKNKTTLNIEVDENNTETERKIVVTLQAGNYFDQVTITQEGE